MTEGCDQAAPATRDGFLGERVWLTQPATGFRSGSDAVLLAAACPAKAGQQILDLGCGAGAAMLCVAARVDGVRLIGIDLQGTDMTAQNITQNSAQGEVIKADITDPPGALQAIQADHVICNPPYFTEGSASPDPAREAARRGLDLAPWIDCACRRAGPKGSVSFIARADRLADLLGGMSGRLGRIAVLPIAGHEGENAGRVIVQGWKGARAPLRLLPPLVLHDANGHTALADAILRDAAPIRL